MAGSKSGAIFSVEIFMEEDELLPIGIYLKFINPSNYGAATVVVSGKDTGQALANLNAYLQ
jgi:hypothetical protein